MDGAGRDRLREFCHSQRYCSSGSVAVASSRELLPSPSCSARFSSSVQFISSPIQLSSEQSLRPFKNSLISPMHTSGDRNARQQRQVGHTGRHEAPASCQRTAIPFSDMRRLFLCSIALVASLAPSRVAAVLCPNDGVTRAALLNLRACANGNVWTTPWSVSEADCCNWAGVGCDPVSGRLLALNVRIPHTRPQCFRAFLSSSKH